MRINYVTTDKRASRGARIFFAALTVALCIVFGGLRVCASDGESETLPPEYQNFIGSLEPSVTDRLPDGVFSDELGDINEAAGELASPIHLLGEVLEALGEGMREVLPSLALLIGIVIISALCRAMSSYFGAGLGKAIDTCARLFTFAAIAGVALGAVGRLGDYFNQLFSAVASFLPLSATLYAMGGNLTAAASSTATLSTILTICQFFCSYTVLPVFCICLCFSLLSVFDGQASMAGEAVCGTLRKWYMTALSFIMMILTSTLATQSILSAKADRAAMRGMKFAVSNFVPISGGTLSSTLGTLAAGVELLRGAVGVIGIAVIIIMLIPPIIQLALMRTVFGIASFCAGMLGAVEEQKLLSELGSLYGYLEGVAALCSAIFLVAFGIFASISVPIA